MSDETEAVTESAKAIKEVAKTGGKLIDAASDAGRFFKAVMGDLVTDGVGLVSDRLKYYRIERAILLAAKTQKRLEDRGITNVRIVSPKIALPIIEKATIEDDESLHTRWANLLANAMDPNFGGQVKRRYVSILSDIEPIDAHILDVVVGEYRAAPEANRQDLLFARANVVRNLRLDANDCEVSLRNLLRLGLIRPGVVTGGVYMGEHQVSAYKDTELFSLTLLGIEFHDAVN
ncbi:MAG: DUF4393 domain-containing protein [Sphingomonadales bacterium]|nr:DUF4393 domain-containing protein [Sphingomonadales bacterium]